MPTSEPAYEMKEPWTAELVQKRIQELGDWFHNMNLGGVQTAPDHFLGDYPWVKWSRFSVAIPDDLRGKTVLDVGCNAGFYALEMKKRGADRVLGIDSSDHYLKQARFASEVTGLKIELANLSVYDVVKDQLIVQSMLRGSSDVEPVEPDYPFAETGIFGRSGFPQMYFVEKKYSHDPTNWWIPNRACLEAMLRSAGFDIVGHPEPEVFVTKASRKEPDMAAEERVEVASCGQGNNRDD
jgi:tRNA (mo5U34)-methyltransferase